MCIDHSDKHLTLQEHTRSLLQLLIALNTFSYCGRFATNRSLVGRYCRPRWGPLPFCGFGELRGPSEEPAKGRVWQPRRGRRSDLGGSGSFRCGLLSCFVVWSVFSSLAGLLPGGQFSGEEGWVFPQAPSTGTLTAGCSRSSSCLMNAGSRGGTGHSKGDPMWE